MRGPRGPRWYLASVDVMQSQTWVWAPTVSKARYKMWRAIKEAGYKVGFGAIKVRGDLAGPLVTEGPEAESIIW